MILFVNDFDKTFENQFSVIFSQVLVILFSFPFFYKVLPVKSEMKNPEQFDSPLGVLNVGLFIVITVDTLFGFYGYLKFGENIQPSITFSLDPSSM